jgi:streptogramin lyase
MPGEISTTEGAVWVSDRRDGSVTRIDPTTAEVTGSEVMAPGLSNYTVGPVLEAAGAAWVLILAEDGTSGGVVALDLETGAVRARRLLEGEPGGLQRVASGVVALVNDPASGQGRLVEVDTASVLGG